MFSKTFTFIAGSLFITSLCAAQKKETSFPSEQCDTYTAPSRPQLTEIYNIPARIDVRGDYDIFFSGTFIYWEALEEGLAVGLTNPSSNSILSGTNANGSFINVDFNFDPGVKVALGVGLNHGDWDLLAEYTRFHQTRHAPLTSAPNLPSGHIQPLWLNDVESATSASATWTLKTDILDAEMGRPCYIATKLTFRPFWGLRAAWISQDYDAIYQISNISVPSDNHSSSWGLGARAGIDTHWLVGYGVRLIGNTAASLLYSHYHLSTKQGSSTTANQTDFSSSEKHNYLRPNMEGALGLGWGSYFDNSTFHLDLSATYEFHAFWSQNLLRLQWGGLAQSSGNTLADLFLQGLNITARFDF